MKTIALQAVPRQKFSVTLDGIQYAITLVAVGNAMVATIAVGGENVVSGVRCMPGQPVIPYGYLEGDGGNFIFLTTEGDLPWYERFGVDQSLVYITTAEWGEIQGL